LPSGRRQREDLWDVGQGADALLRRFRRQAGDEALSLKTAISQRSFDLR
jgi:hypothetical protein